jgi:hypothetical protein
MAEKSRFKVLFPPSFFQKISEMANPTFSAPPPLPKVLVPSCRRFPTRLQALTFVIKLILRKIKKERKVKLKIIKQPFDYMEEESIFIFWCFFSRTLLGNQRKKKFDRVPHWLAGISFPIGIFFLPIFYFIFVQLYE